jgi:hypothetical protein
MILASKARPALTLRSAFMLTILLIAAVICFFLAAFGVASSKVNLLGLGLAFWALAVTIEKMVL